MFELDVRSKRPHSLEKPNEQLSHEQIMQHVHSELDKIQEERNAKTCA